MVVQIIQVGMNLSKIISWSLIICPLSFAQGKDFFRYCDNYKKYSEKLLEVSLHILFSCQVQITSLL